jgi:uncharacterized protein YukE
VNLFKSPFEKLALQELKGINDNSFVLVSTLTSGGELFSIFKNMEKYLKMIANGETKEKKGGGLFGNRNTVLVKVSNASAKALGVGLDGIGEGLKKIAEALQMVGDSSEAQKRMGVLILGIKQIEQLGKAIFKFGLWMVGATVLLAIGSVGVGLFALQMYTLYTIFDLLDKNKFDQKVNTAVPALKDAAIGVAITGLALATFAVIVAIVNNPLAALGLMALTIVTVAGIFWLAGNFAPQIALGATAMLEASFAVGIIALSTALFAAFVPPNADGFTTIGQIGLAILTVGTVMALAGIPPVPALIVAGAGSMIFAGLAIILIGLGISMFAKAISGSESIFEDSGHATKGFSVLGIQIIEGGRPMSKIEWALLSIARSFMLPPAAIASMYVGAPAMIMAGMALWWVGTGIKKFQDLKIDYGVLGKQIGKAVYAIADAFGEIGAKYPGSGPTFSTIFLGDYSGASPVYQGIKAVHGMGKALSGIAMGIQYMSDLKFPTAWDKNGNPTQFRTLTDADFARVTTNTQMIVKSLSETFGEIGSSDAANDSWGWFGHSAIEEGIQIARDFAEPLMGLAKFINEFGKIKVDTALVTKKTQDIIFAMTGTFGQVGAMPEAEDNWGWFGNSVIEEGISIVTGIAEPLFKLAEFVKIFNETDVDTTALITKSQNIISAMASIFAGEGSMKFDANTRLTMTTIANSYGRMATSMEDWKESINDLDLEKVTEVRKLYEGLAYLSKNNGDTLIEDLGESLIEAIEALSEALAKFGGQGGGSTAPAAAPASSSTAGSKPAGATGGNPESYAELLEAVNLMKSRLEGTLTVALAPGTVLSNG